MSWNVSLRKAERGSPQDENIFKVHRGKWSMVVVVVHVLSPLRLVLDEKKSEREKNALRIRLRNHYPISCTRSFDPARSVARPINRVPLFLFCFLFFFVGRSRGCDHRIRTDDYDRGRADWRWFLSSAIGSAASLLTRTEASPTSIPSMGIRLFVGPFGLSMGNVAFFIEKKMFLPSLFPSYAENRFLFVPSVGTRRIESRFRTCRSAALEFQFWFSFTESQFQASKIGGSVE